MVCGVIFITEWEEVGHLAVYIFIPTSMSNVELSNMKLSNFELSEGELIIIKFTSIMLS